MWYVVDADPGAELIIGFKEDCSRDTYLDALDNDTVEDLLQHVPVTKGDVFFIPAGLVHAIGKGVVVAEIQQSSDVTYRIYDFKRKDDQGNERELHTDEALDVINFSASLAPKTPYKAYLNALTPLVSCSYFSTSMLRFNEPLERDYTSLDSFVAYMCLEGMMEIRWDEDSLKVKAGDTVLVPAIFYSVQLIPFAETVLLEVFVP